MYRPGNAGIGNLFIHLTQSDIVSNTIYTNHRHKYIDIGLNIIEDDGTMEDKQTNIYIGDPIHARIRNIIKPTEFLCSIIDKYDYLVKDVEFAFQIRRCAYASDITEVLNHDNYNYCTNETLEKFYDIMNKTTGNVYITSDCLKTKIVFKNRWPDRVRILEEKTTHTRSDDNEDPWVPFLEFFLLSKCPYIFLTGGDPKTGMSISTYGYMAAIYGNKPYTFVFN